MKCGRSTVHVPSTNSVKSCKATTNEVWDDWDTVNGDIQHDIYQHCGKPTAKNLHLPIYRRIKRASDLLHDMTIGIPAAYRGFHPCTESISWNISWITVEVSWNMATPNHGCFFPLMIFFTHFGWYWGPLILGNPLTLNTCGIHTNTIPHPRLPRIAITPSGEKASRDREVVNRKVASQLRPAGTSIKFLALFFHG